LVIFDVDGVLTDGGIYVADDGHELRAFNVRDGHGIRMLKANGVEVAVISGRHSCAVQHRMADLDIPYVFQGQRNKGPVFEALLGQLNLEPVHAAFVGDDVVDLPMMRKVGLAIAVQDAHALVRQHAHWQTINPGGHGAVREVCELILKAHGKLDEALAWYQGET
jgi:3-deoxy-D-manno-octulosonate 8-phosphate phosphatase, YrbI family